VQLCRNSSLTWLGQGVVLDGWGQGTPPPDASGETVKKPLMSISSEAFMHWKENFESIVGICEEARDSGALCWMMTIAGSTHLVMTDFAVLYRRWMTILTKSMVHPLRAFYLTVAASLEFLSLTLPAEQTKYNVWIDEGLLLSAKAPVEPGEAMRSDHAPDHKWVAVKLKIRNELWTRLRAWAKRSWRRIRGRREHSGLLGQNAEEMWTHMSPTAEEVAPCTRQASVAGR